MHIEEFQLERLQSLWENRVKYNLTESGIHPYTLRELLQASHFTVGLALLEEGLEEFARAASH